MEISRDGREDCDEPSKYRVLDLAAKGQFQGGPFNLYLSLR